MNITFVNDSLGYGGAGKMMMVIAHGLKEKGHNVSIINLNLRNNKVYQDYQDLPVITAHLKYGKGFLVNIKYAWFTFKEAKKLKSEVLIGFKSYNNFCVSIASKLLHIPSIISERADPYMEFGNVKFPHSIKLDVINRATGAVFQTKGASEFYSKHLQENCAIIPNPIFIEKKIPSIDYSKRPKTVVYLGRIANKQKRLDVLVKAFALFYDKHPDYSLHIYGNGVDEDKLNSFIKENDVKDSVILKGVSHDSINDLSKEGIFIITSDYEGISNSLLEAMAVGLPVVSTDHSPGGARLLIKDHENGLLAPVGDYTALANALSEYVDKPLLAEKCGRNARKVSDRFSISKAVNTWDSYIKKIIERY